MDPASEKRKRKEGDNLREKRGQQLNANTPIRNEPAGNQV
jgi:hypothetical protein